MVEFPTNILKPCGLQLSSDPKGAGHQIPNNSGILNFVQKVIFISIHLHIKYIPVRHYQHSPWFQDRQCNKSRCCTARKWQNVLKLWLFKNFWSKKYLKKNCHFGLSTFISTSLIYNSIFPQFSYTLILSVFKTCECVRRDVHPHKLEI